MTQLTLTEPPAEPVTSTDAAMLFHWIDNGVSPSGNVPETERSMFGSHRPFDGPPDPERRMWPTARIIKALELLEDQGCIRLERIPEGLLGFWATDEGRRRYGRMNLNDHLRNRGKHGH